MRINKLKLIVLMAEKGLSVEQLSKSSGVSTSTISGVRGGKSCSTKTAKALADCFNVPLESFLQE